MAIYDLVDKTNSAAIKFVEQNEEKIDKICQPLLNHLNIENFTYFNILSNGYGITLSNQPHINQVYCNYLSKEGVLHPDKFKKPSFGQPHYTPWSRHSLFPEYDFPLATGINIWKKDTNHYEGFVFFTQKTNCGLQSLFIDNLSLLEKFAEYFKIQAKELIEINDPQKLVFIRNVDFSKDDDFESLNKIQQFLEEIKPTCLTIRSRYGGEVLLSEEETDCMIMLYAREQHYKEIVQELKIADQTVETHIRRIRDKTGYHRISSLIKAADENFKKWFKFRVLYSQANEKVKSGNH